MPPPSREFDLLLGQLSQDGSRTPGLVDHLQATPGGTQKVIEAVAADSERKGMFEESVKLYDLAGKHEKVIALLNKLLSQVRKWIRLSIVAVDRNQYPIMLQRNPLNELNERIEPEFLDSIARFQLIPTIAQSLPMIVLHRPEF